jgi:hypothetical protein
MKVTRNYYLRMGVIDGLGGQSEFEYQRVIEGEEKF